MAGMACPCLMSGLWMAITFSLVGFTPIGGHHGVAVYYRPGAGAIELAADGAIDAPLEDVMAVLTNYEEHPRMVERLAENRVLERHPNELYVYQRLKLPVITDRDFTLHVRWTAQSTQFQIDPSRGPPPFKHVVRMVLLNGGWELQRLSGVKTLARYHVVVDFGGSVPRWMVRRGAAKDIPRLYEGLRRLVAERRARR